MNSTRASVISMFVAVLATPSIFAQDLSTYREFRLGMTLPAVAKLAHAKASEAKVIYERPAVIQELEWRLQRPYGSQAPVDPVNEILFGFYNGELYRIVVNYDEDRTQGLTDKDIIESIATKYGTAITPVAKIVSSSASRAYSDSATVIARWEDSDYSLNLFRFTYGSAPGMLVFSKRLDALAQTAITEAIRLNEQEAPQREIERLQKQDADKDAAGQKIRPVNKANFRP